MKIRGLEELKIVQSFIQDGEVKQNLIEIACKKVGKVSVQKTTMVINSIRHSDDTTLLMNIITDILSYWIVSLKKDINNYVKCINNAIIGIFLLRKVLKTILTIIDKKCKV